MLSNNEIKSIIEGQLSTHYVMVDGDGYKYNAVIVSEEFESKSLVKRQQLIYEILKQYINDGTIHAISMKTVTPKEWEQVNG